MIQAQGRSVMSHRRRGPLLGHLLRSGFGSIAYCWIGPTMIE